MKMMTEYKFLVVAQFTDTSRGIQGQTSYSYSRDHWPLTVADIEYIQQDICKQHGEGYTCMIVNIIQLANEEDFSYDEEDS